jgi:hypothetical protein
VQVPLQSRQLLGKLVALLLQLDQQDAVGGFQPSL